MGEIPKNIIYHLKSQFYKINNEKLVGGKQNITNDKKSNRQNINKANDSIIRMLRSKFRVLDRDVPRPR